MVVSRIIPSLGLRKKSDAALDEYAKQRIDNLTTNKLKFPGLVPDAIALAVLEQAFADAIRKLGPEGGHSATLNRDTARNNLEIGLQTCAQNCAEISGSSEYNYSLSGFGMKQKPVKVTSLPAPDKLAFKQGPLDGSVYGTFKGVKNAKSYELWVGKTSDTTTWTMFNINSGSPVLITDLTPLSIYFGRCRAIGARNIKGEWSPVIEFKVM